MPAPAATIGEVISALTEIIANARASASRLGYFAALYRRVTQTVKDDIAAGKFQNGPLVERLDVVFANRYLVAFAQFQAGQTPTQSWLTAFRTATDPLPLILQQLLLGINAHINLDLGIATAAVAPGDQLPGIKSDFDRINDVLAGLVSTVENELASVSPSIHLLEEKGMRTESTIINFSLDKARAKAWAVAQKFAVLPTGLAPAATGFLDLEVATLAEAVAHPPLAIDAALAPIRLTESNDVRRVIDVLSAPAAT